MRKAIIKVDSAELIEYLGLRNCVLVETWTDNDIEESKFVDRSVRSPKFYIKLWSETNELLKETAEGSTICIIKLVDLLKDKLERTFDGSHS